MQYTVSIVVILVLIASVFGILFSQKRIALHRAEREKQKQELDAMKQRVEGAEKRQQEINRRSQ